MQLFFAAAIQGVLIAGIFVLFWGSFLKSCWELGWALHLGTQLGCLLLLTVLWWCSLTERNFMVTHCYTYKVK